MKNLNSRRDRYARKSDRVLNNPITARIQTILNKNLSQAQICVSIKRKLAYLQITL